jgi:hypothetical protein
MNVPLSLAAQFAEFAFQDGRTLIRRVRDRGRDLSCVHVDQ